MKELSFPQWQQVLAHIHKNEIEDYASNIAKKMDITFSHMVNILNVLEEKGIVKFSKVGRIKQVKLTDKGKRVAVCCNILIKEV